MNVVRDKSHSAKFIQFPLKNYTSVARLKGISRINVIKLNNQNIYSSQQLFFLYISVNADKEKFLQKMTSFGIDLSKKESDEIFYVFDQKWEFIGNI
jgi:hypothetical protein